MEDEEIISDEIMTFEEFLSKCLKDCEERCYNIRIKFNGDLWEFAEFLKSLGYKVFWNYEPVAHLGMLHENCFLAFYAYEYKDSIMIEDIWVWEQI
ncbi:MAG: hypothetical protein QXT27_06445 [Pyrobaculum sp.]